MTRQSKNSNPSPSEIIDFTQDESSDEEEQTSLFFVTRASDENDEDAQTKKDPASKQESQQTSPLSTHRDQSPPNAPRQVSVVESTCRAETESSATPSDLEKTFMSVLLEWLATEANYDQWSRGTTSKESLCAVLNHLLENYGICRRDCTIIRTNIWALEQSLSMANVSLAQAGFRGLAVLNACNDQLKERILQYCPYYDILAPVMMKSAAQEVQEMHSSAGTAIVKAVQEVARDELHALDEFADSVGTLSCDQDEKSVVETGHSTLVRSLLL